MPHEPFESSSKEQNCTKCKYFKSFREEYFGDPEELEEVGFCQHDDQEEETVDEDICCDLFEQ